MQKLDPKYFLKFFSNSITLGPLVIKDDFKVLTTEDISDFECYVCYIQLQIQSLIN